LAKGNLSSVSFDDALIGNCISVTVVEVKESKVRLGFSAPENVSILRSELATWLTFADEPSKLTETDPTDAASEQFVG
jgi:carbon storage regulator CsrA